MKGKRTERERRENNKTSRVTRPPSNSLGTRASRPSPPPPFGVVVSSSPPPLLGHTAKPARPLP
eukprot:6144369-Pyramimonas_sp.AAC.1